MLAAARLCWSCLAAVFFDHAAFDATWVRRWTDHAWHEDSEPFTLRRGRLHTSVDARFYHVSAPFDAPFRGDTLVLQYRVWHTRRVECGGGYVKLVDSSAHDDSPHTKDTPYRIMFGPDACGQHNQTRVIFSHNGTYHERSEPLPCPVDTAPHVYTLRLTRDGLYSVHIDNEHKASGALRDDWAVLPARNVVDPRFVKPTDWVDERLVDDPADEKPADWDDEETAVDPKDAAKPADWSDEHDGEWSPSIVPNPRYRGAWAPRKVPNPAYRGEWQPRMVSNPEHFDDSSIGDFAGVDTLAIEIWQVKAGSSFDHFLVTDDAALAAARADALLGASTRRWRKDEL